MSIKYQSVLYVEEDLLHAIKIQDNFVAKDFCIQFMSEHAKHLATVLARLMPVLCKALSAVDDDIGGDHELSDDEVKALIADIAKSLEEESVCRSLEA